jgi:probable F420-dependent oxidoreductase
VRPFRFGVLLDPGVAPQALADRARRVEDLGYGIALVSDHAHAHPGPLVAATAVAVATTSLRIGTLVLNNDLRHPAVVARDVAALDALSGGRFELGLGAGWRDADYARTGIARAPAAVRIARLGEAVDVVTGLLGEAAFSYRGDHYRVDGGDDHPPASQRPHLPILVGGGSPRILRLAGRAADIASLVPPWASPQAGGGTQAPTAADMVAWVREGCGPGHPLPELSTLVFDVAVTERPGRIADRYRALHGRSIDDPSMLPTHLAGPAPAIAERLAAARERLGLSYVVVRERAAASFAPVVCALAGR